jgi:hypothetical protein
MTIAYKHTNPFPSGFSPSRLDMGFDGTFEGHIVAPVWGEIIYAGLFNGWMGSHGVILHHGGPNQIGLPVPTGCLYFIEGCMPMVRSGQMVNAGERIAYPVRNPYNSIIGNIEWGVSDFGPVGQQANAYAMTLGTGSAEAREMVLNFAKWAHEVLGVPEPTSTTNAGHP